MNFSGQTFTKAALRSPFVVLGSLHALFRVKMVKASIHQQSWIWNLDKRAGSHPPWSSHRPPQPREWLLSSGGLQKTPHHQQLPLQKVQVLAIGQLTYQRASWRWLGKNTNTNNWIIECTLLATIWIFAKQLIAKRSHISWGEGPTNWCFRLLLHHEEHIALELIQVCDKTLGVLEHHGILCHHLQQKFLHASLRRLLSFNLPTIRRWHRENWENKRVHLKELKTNEHWMQIMASRVTLSRKGSKWTWSKSASHGTPWKSFRKPSYWWQKTSQFWNFSTGSHPFLAKLKLSTPLCVRTRTLWIYYEHVSPSWKHKGNIMYIKILMYIPAKDSISQVYFVCSTSKYPSWHALCT